MAFSQSDKQEISFLKQRKRFNRKQRVVYTVRKVDNNTSVSTGRVLKAIFKAKRIRVTEIAYSLQAAGSGKLNLKKLPRCQFVFSGTPEALRKA
jgi:hypothetical protein